MVCVMVMVVPALAREGCREKREQMPELGLERNGPVEKDHAPSADFEEAEEDTRFIYEPIGWIEPFGTKEGEVRDKLGQPDSAGEEYESQIDGCFVQDLYYLSEGIILEMAAGEKKKEKQVSSIFIESPCTLKTEKGIGIGSKEEEVLAKYEGFINKKYSNKGINVMLGNIYGGTFFNIEEGTVVSIFVGAGAE